jgi:hypothetical protein
LRHADTWAAAHHAARIQMVAPTPDIGRLYERFGYAALETVYQRHVRPPMPDLDTVAAACRTRTAAGAPPLASIAAAAPVLDADAIRVFDDVIPDVADYRAWAQSLPYRTVTIGPAHFHGIAETTDDTLSTWLRETFPAATPGLTFFRSSPAGQVEPNFIHTDRDMGDWTAILYVTDTPPEGDGTTFWRHRATGATASTATTEAAFRDEWHAWRDRAQWEPWHTVAARPGRVIVFPAPLFHSRAIEANYGAGVDARLIQLVFGTGPLERTAVCV